MTEAEASAVSELHHLLDVHEAPGGDDFDHEAILSDPAWLEVVAAARRARERLARLLRSDAERHLLLTGE